MLEVITTRQVCCQLEQHRQVEEARIFTLELCCWHTDKNDREIRDIPH